MTALSVILTVCTIFTQAVTTKQVTDREHDGFAGPVKRVFVEWSPIYMSYGDTPLGSRCRQLTDLYDKNGRLMRHSVYFGSCGSDEIRDEYSYAQGGSRTSKTVEIRAKNSPPPLPGIAVPGSNPKETGPPRTLFTYGTSGRLVEEASVTPSGKVNHKTRYSYDARGRMTEMAGYQADGQVSVRRVYSYVADDRVPSGFTYYGGDGKVYERTSYSAYEFNSFGDWVKRKQTTEETLNRKSISWSIREIEYHPQ